MKVLIVSNFPIKSVANAEQLPFIFNEGWVSASIAMLQTKDCDIYYAFPQKKVRCMLNGCVDGISYYGFPRITRENWKFDKHTEQYFVDIFQSIKDIDVIHIMGTEYGHTLSAVLAAKRCGLEKKLVISIQGLVSILSKHYFADLPMNILKKWTVRDFLRWDNLWNSQRKAFERGLNEIKALQSAYYVIGRTDFDRACTTQINPHIQYRFCNETLRQPFYSGEWNYSTCKKHSVFMSQGYYSAKGLHYMLEALNIVKKFYPDVTLSLTGTSPLTDSWLARQRKSVYMNYIADLIKKYQLEQHVSFLGSLDANEMKQQYLTANVFCSPSAIENSPNSVGEAMLLGTPVVCSDVGGVKNLIVHEEEGYIYQHNAPYMLAHYIMKVFGAKEGIVPMVQKARAHAQETHDPQKNLSALISIYEEIASN